MNPYIEKLKAYLDQYPRDRENIETVIEVLCHYYTVEHSVENGVIQAEFLDLGPILDKLSRKDNDALFGITMRLCMDYADQAFQAGLRTGLQLFTELYQDTLYTPLLGC